MNPIIHNW